MKKSELFPISFSREKWKKRLRAGKAFLVFFLAFSLQMSASIASQRKVNLNLTDVTVKKLLKEIENQTDLGFLYNIDEIKKIRNVSVEAKDMAVDQVLEKVLKGTGLTYEIDKNVIIIKPEPSKEKEPDSLKQEKQDPIVIKGKVTNEAGESLPSATIVELSNSGFNGTSADMDGNFSLEVSGTNSVLQISYVGFKTTTVVVGTQKFITVTMETSKQNVDEVVVTGMFVRNKESYTGSTSVISGEKLKQAGSVNVFQALKNLDPTMTIAEDVLQGSNPSNMPDIQIRGTSSLGIADVGDDVNSTLKGNYLKSANQPLFIVDGFEASIEYVYDMDMDRIESITILKDAAAKAIYGSKAANGVVVIETKKLLSNETRVTWKSSLDLEMPDLSSYDLTNASEKLQAEVIDGMYMDNDADDLIELTKLYNSRNKLALEGLNTDWLSKPVRTGVGQKHALTVEIGSENLKVLADLAYKRISGVMKGSYRENISGALNMSYRVDKLLFRNIINVNSNNAEDSPYGTFNDYVKMNPYWRSENADGSIPYYAEISPDGNTKYTNPLYNSTLNSKIASSYLNVTNNFYLEWNIMTGLKATTRIGVGMKRSDGDEFYPSSHTMFESFTNSNIIEDNVRAGSYQVNNGKSSSISGDFNLNYSKSIKKHFYFSNIGFNISENKYQEVVHLVEGFPSERMDNIFFGRAYALESTPTGVEGITRDVGALGVFSYMYDNRFLSDLTLRTNASSLFGADKRWANFWSLGLGWNAHNEDFLKGGPFSQLKIRGSVGSTGNQNFNTNASIATYSYFLDAFYQGFVGSYIQNLANSLLQWESKFEYNAGFDARIKRLSLKFDYYQSNTENLITDITTPLSTGFSSVKENIGKVKNSGIEISSSYLVWSRGENFLNLNFSIATNKNEITELSDAMRAFNEAADEAAADELYPVHKYEDGISMNAIWAVPSLGIDPATGHEIYVDREGNSTFEWNAKDMVVCGNSSPDYRGNFSINGEYKGFGINVTCRYFGGGQYYNQTLVDRVENVDMNYNVDRRVLTGRWTTIGQIASFKKLGVNRQDKDGDGIFESVTYGVNRELTRATSRFVQDYNELDISAVNVYYDFSNALLQKMNLGIERLKLSVNMNEIARISTVKAERGTSYPFARTLSCSLTATF